MRVETLNVGTMNGKGPERRFKDIVKEDMQSLCDSRGSVRLRQTICYRETYCKRSSQKKKRYL